MSDFVLRKKDGWVEISDLLREVNPDVQKEIWEYLCRGTIADAADALEIEIGDLLEGRIGLREIQDVKGFLAPHDVAGQVFKVWVKVAPSKGRS